MLCYAKSFQLCLTLCDPIDGSPPGSPVLGILQARTLEWVAIPSPMHESEKSKRSRSVVSDSQRPHGLQPTRLLRPWDFPSKSTGVGCHCLLCDIYTLLFICMEYIANQNLLYSTGNSVQCSFFMLNQKEIKKEGIFAYTQLIHFAIQQKLTKHCKANIFHQLCLFFFFFKSEQTCCRVQQRNRAATGRSGINKRLCFQIENILA